MNTKQQIVFDQEMLQHILEPLIRRVIREEFAKIAQEQPNIFFMNLDMPLYHDMERISEKKRDGTIELLSHEEVWDE